jgi:hypothetical protein
LRTLCIAIGAAVVGTLVSVKVASHILGKLW